MLEEGDLNHNHNERVRLLTSDATQEGDVNHKVRQTTERYHRSVPTSASSDSAAAAAGCCLLLLLHSLAPDYQSQRVRSIVSANDGDSTCRCRRHERRLHLGSATVRLQHLATVARTAQQSIHHSKGLHRQ